MLSQLPGRAADAARSPALRSAWRGRGERERRRPQGGEGVRATPHRGLARGDERGEL
jgi:hypothetical protein